MNVWSSITVQKIQNVFVVPSIRGYDTTIKEREFYGLSFAYGGRISYHWNGKRYLSDASHAILLPQGETYFLCREESGDFPVINFTCDKDFNASGFLLTPLCHPQSYLRDFERMRSLWLSQKNPAKVMSIFYDILSRLAEENVSDAPDLLAPAMEYLGKHFDDPLLSNAILAEQAKISEVYFRKLFKEAYGVSPHHYLLETRMRHAKLLLSEHAATVTSIAEACGFSSVYHFCRAFKHYTGQTPKEFEEGQRPL